MPAEDVTQIARDYLALQAQEFEEASTLHAAERAIDTRHTAAGTSYSATYFEEREAASANYHTKVATIRESKQSLDTEAKKYGLGHWLRFRELCSQEIYAVEGFFKGKFFDSHAAAKQAIDQAFDLWTKEDIRASGAGLFDIKTKKAIRAWHAHVRHSRLKYLDDVLARAL